MIIEASERLRTDLTSWRIGPYDANLPGAMRLDLKLDGEIIVAASVETGFLHRGLEKAFELHFWESAIPYADRLDPECAIFGELAVCLAVEEAAELPAPPRAQAIRMILSELARICAHMAYVARVARSVGSETMIHYALRDRERVLDLFELVAGARFALNFLCFGGVKADVTEGFIERVLEVCDLFRIRLKEYNDLFTYNHAFIKRTEGVGVLGPDRIRALGITGPNARAAGVPIDFRKEHPYIGYEKIDFVVPTGKTETPLPGDSNERFLLRLREISVSDEILKQAAEAVPPGAFRNSKATEGLAVLPGEAYSRVESSRGLLGCHIISDGSSRPGRIQFRPPSLAHIAAIPELVRGIRIEDLPVVLASMDIGLAEADR